jgi:peptide/nickel transport system substrate-binding protein
MVQPQQSGWSINSPFYDAKLLKTAIEYDVNKANQLLDQAGLEKRDSAGWRLRSDGKRLELNMLTWTGSAPDDKDAELIMADLRAVGLFINFRKLDWSALQEIRNSNSIELVYDPYNWGTNEGSYYQAVSLGVPYNRGWWAPLWTTWMLTNGAQGEEPIPEVMEAIEAYWSFLSAVDITTQKREMSKITTIASENLWTIGTISTPGYTVIYNAKLHNLPSSNKAWGRAQWGRPQVWYVE